MGVVSPPLIRLNFLGPSWKVKTAAGGGARKEPAPPPKKVDSAREVEERRKHAPFSGERKRWGWASPSAARWRRDHSTPTPFHQAEAQGGRETHWGGGRAHRETYKGSAVPFFLMCVCVWDTHTHTHTEQGTFHSSLQEPSPSLHRGLTCT